MSIRDQEVKGFIPATANSIRSFFKGAQAGGQTWDLFGFHLFSLSKAAPYTTQLLRPPKGLLLFVVNFL